MFSATISKCYPTTGSYKIVLDESGSDEEYEAIPLLPYKSNDGMSSIRYVLEVGSRVLVSRTEDGEHVILGCLPITTERHDSKGRVTTSNSTLTVDKATAGDSDLVGNSVYLNTGEDNYSTFEDIDMLPGDIRLSSPGGSALKVLRGGLTSIGSPTATIQTNMSDSSITSKSSRRYIETGMGNLTIEDNNAGSFSMEFKGNTNPTSSNTNIFFSVSSAGGKPNMEISLGDFGFRITSSGDIVLKGSRVLWDNGTEVVEISKDKSFWDILTGSGTSSTSVKSSTSGSRSNKTLGNSRTSVGGESHDTAGDKRSITTMGPSPTKKPAVAVAPDTVNARTDTVASGSMSTKIGAPTSGGGSYHVDTFSGDIKFSTNTGASPLIGGTVSLSSTAQVSKTGGAFGMILDSPRTVVGGGTGLNTPGVPALQSSFAPVPGGLNPTMSGACKFEALFTYLKALHTQLDSHIHTIPTVPMVYPVVGPGPIFPPLGFTAPIPSAAPTTLPPVVPFTPTLSALALRIESQSLWLMGT